MKHIGGNVTACIQLKETMGKNAVGERKKDWTTVRLVQGFLDLSNGDSKYTNYNAKTQESTHLFICDYFPIDITNKETRMIINNAVYDISLIDDPMGMHEHLEIYLSFVG